MMRAGVATNCDYATAAEVTTVDLVVKFTGTLAVATDTIYQLMFLVELIP